MELHHTCLVMTCMNMRDDMHVSASMMHDGTHDDAHDMHDDMRGYA